MRNGEHGTRRGTAGYAYLLLLLTLALLAVAASGSVVLGHALERRAAERALLETGDEFRRALQSWRRFGAAGPATLEDLLRDPRALGVRRHLRRLPHDPLTGTPQWGLVLDGQRRIVAVYSLAPGRPLQRAGFDALAQPGFEDAESYAQWRFGLVPVRVPVPSAPPAPGAPATSPTQPTPAAPAPPPTRPAGLPAS